MATLAAMSGGSGPRILLVEDESSIADPFAKLLRREGFDAIIARTAAEALERARDLEPDLVLLDLALPDGDGRDVCRTLRATSSVPVIMVTARGTETDKIVGLEIGADDYVVKPFEPDELTARVRAVLRRADPPESPRTVTIGELTIDFDRRLAMRGGSPIQLGRTEWQVLRKLAREPGQVVLSTDLLRDIWGEGYADDLQVLRICISRLRRKLGATGRDDSLIRTYHNVGYALEA